jgi:hypothetical protein
MTRRLILLVVVIAVGLLALRQSYRSGTTPAPMTPRLARLGELSEAERRYGLAPEPTDAVTYQPDVVIVEGGAGIIRMAGADGLTWTIDPDAPGARDLHPGKIMLVTGRAVGRVLGTRRTPEGLMVFVGPVTLEEVAANLDLNLDLPLDLSQGLVYFTPDVPGMSVEPVAVSARSFDDADEVKFRVVPAVVRQGPGTPRPQPAPTTEDVVFRTRQLVFRVFKPMSDHGVGARISADAGGTRVVAQASMSLSTPRVRAVTKGGMYLEFEGAAGMRLGLQIYSDHGARASINEDLVLPTSWYFPIIGAGVPLGVTINQRFIVKTAFSSSGGFEAKGGFGLYGALRLGYIDGTMGLRGPSFGAYDSFLQSLKGVSLAPNGLILSHQVTITVGIGGGGFAAGPYVGLRSSVGLTSGSSIGIIYCKGTTVDLDLVGGIGYTIPQVVADVINEILSFFGAHVSSSGGVQLVDKNLQHRNEINSDSRTCKAIGGRNP